MRPRKRSITRQALLRRRQRLAAAYDLKERAAAVYDEAADFLHDSLAILESLLGSLHVDFETAEDPVSNDPELYEAVTRYDYGSRSSRYLEQFSYGITKSIELSKRAAKLTEEAKKLERQEKSSRQVEEAMEFERSYFGR